MKLPLALALLGALTLVSCSTSSDPAPLRTNAGVTIYSPPGDVLTSRPAAPC